MAIWKYKLDSDTALMITDKGLLKKYGNRRDKIENRWYLITFTENAINIIVRKDYAWDGCSPKFKLGGKIFGIWDGFFNASTHEPDTYFASLAHDVLLQFLGEHPIKRNDCDWIFYWMLCQSNFPFSFFYYVAVRIWSITKTLYELHTVK